MVQQTPITPYEKYKKLVEVLEAKGEITSFARHLLLSVFIDLMNKATQDAYNEGWNDCLEIEMELEAELE